MRDINHGRLRYFQAVWKAGTIRGAAEALNTAPSVVTRQITLLEEEIGTTLFERQARGMKATEAATFVDEYWRGCQVYQQHLSDRLRALGNSEEGDVRIVLSEGFTDHLVQSILGPFCSAHPKLRVSLDPLPVSEIINQVANDAAHLGLAYNPQADARVSFFASAAAPAKLLLRPDHQLSGSKQPIPVSALASLPFALMPPGYGAAQLVEALEYAEHFKIKPVFVSSSIAALKSYVSSTNSVTIIGAVAAESETQSGELVVREIAHELCQSAKIRVLVRRGRPLSPAVSGLLTRIKGKLSSFG